MQDLARYMDPFFGNGTVDLPQPEGIAATWFFIKAQTGNTHPGACAPLGMISVCPYSGAYVTGYGKNAPNTHATPPQRFKSFVASGFTHLQQSGTGAIDTYYNYFRVIPLLGSLDQIGTRWELQGETARPGYYAATLAGAGIRAELTASSRAAFHRYTFTQPGTARIAIDFSNGGIDFPGMGTYPAEASVALTSANACEGYVVMEGMTLYVAIETDLPEPSGALWLDGQELRGRQAWSLVDSGQGDGKPFGVAFSTQVAAGTAVHVRLGLSLRSIAQARRNLRQIDTSFDQISAATLQEWNACANRLVVDGTTEAQKTVLYSSLYHSLAKPADWNGESPWWNEGPFYVDFATMWDQYKTQLPLLLTLFPERAPDLINSLLSLGEYAGGFPSGFVLNTDLTAFDGQARSLAHYAIADAYYRRVEGIDWERALRVMVADLEQARNATFFGDGIVYPITHNLDLAGACFCTARLAQRLGERELYGRMMRASSGWRKAYDPSTGKLVEGKYYEGGLWNYSFRLLHDMRGRIALYPAEADFVADLDRFFGYGQPPVVQPTDPQDRAYMQWGHSLNRFEGYNNEPDIETPYAYIYAGRPDRTAEVVQAGMRYMFTTGRGGLPGNNDSGGLTSCHVWDAIGLFPVTGQPLFLIGSPLVGSATLRLAGKTFTVEASNHSEENIYVQGASLNGTAIDRAYLNVQEVLRGGTLTLTMGPRPSDWAHHQRPPSYPAP